MAFAQSFVLGQKLPLSFEHDVPFGRRCIVNDLLVYGIGGTIITIACQVLVLEANDKNPVNWKPFIIGSALGVSALVVLYFVVLSCSE